MASNFIGSGGSPGGSDAQVQYNNGGAFGGATGLTYDDSTTSLTIPATAFATNSDPTFIIGRQQAYGIVDLSASSGDFAIFSPLFAVTAQSNNGTTDGSITAMQALASGLAGGSGNMNTITGLALDAHSAKNATTVQGIGINTTVTGGTVTTAYGINMSDVTGASTNYAIKTGLGSVSFGDDVTLANGKALKPDTTTGHTLLLQGYDNNTGPAYVTFLTITNGNSPDFTIAPPAGGATVVIQATTYKSSDASVGITQTVTTGTLVGMTMTFKNGLLTSFAA